MNTEMLMQYITYALGGIGILAFLVSVVVQVIKEMPILKKIQTNVVALGVALILTPTAVVVLCVCYKIVIEWYYVFCFVSGSIYCVFGKHRGLGTDHGNLEQKQIQRIIMEGE